MRTAPLLFALLACAEAAAPVAVGTSDATNGVPADGTSGPPDVVTLAPDVEAPPLERAPDFGAACVENADCTGGYCVATDRGHVCSQTCIEECPDDFVCRQLVGQSLDVAFVCVPPAGNLCGACFDDAQCFGGRCLALDGDAGRRSCLSPCVAGEEDGCGGGTECVELEGQSVCAPLSRTCTCNQQTLGIARPCAATNEVGTCRGFERCEAPGWAACDAPVPSTESCNGKDDDCDGAYDEELPPPPCPAQAGVCGGATAACGGALGWLGCSAQSYGSSYETTESTCDQLDNDCDGETDDVDLDHDGHRPLACGGDDCDDLNPVVRPGHPEVCGDGLDNDCSGVAEDRDHDSDGYLATACGGDDCNDVAAVAKPGAPELCGNGLDDDCSGGIDDLDADSDGFSACGGKDCDDSSDSAYPGAPELCNERDDDCDGVTDEKDVDGDGHIDLACGGDDCDDGAALVHPGVLEWCGDMVDDDCSGLLDDRDRDGDGHVDLACGGDDCDDVDLLVYPAATELYDTKDSDCDGTVDEGLVGPGTLVLTELSLARGWVEVTNLGVLPVNLASMTIESGLGVATLPVAPAVVVAPGHAAVLCVETDPAENGGAPCAAALPLTLGSGVRVLLAGVLLDAIETAGYATEPLASVSLDPNQYGAAGNDVAGHWCPSPASALQPNGERASPGAVNPSCSGAPAVIAVTPTSGVDNGGETITLSGSGFTAVSGVTVGGTPCQSFVISSDTRLRCVTPAGVAGPADIVVVKGGQLGTAPDGYTYIGEAVKLIDWCDIQFPTAVSAPSGGNSGVVYGRVHAPNLTKLVGAPAGIMGQMGFGPKGSDPRNMPGWVWFPATWNPTCGGEPCGPNDEFYAVVNATTPEGPAASGEWSLAYRFSDDGGVNFMTCDLLPGTADGFSTSKLAKLTVE